MALVIAKQFPMTGSNPFYDWPGQGSHSRQGIFQFAIKLPLYSLIYIFINFTMTTMTTMTKPIIARLLAVIGKSFTKTTMTEIRINRCATVLDSRCG